MTGALILRQITAIEPQENPRSGRANLFLDGKFAFSLSEELAARLPRGTFLSEAEVADLQRQDNLHRIRGAALTLLSFRPRSVSEVRGRLLRRGFDPTLVEEVLERLRGQGMLDDAGFAQFWVENRQAHRPRGGRLLQAELRAKGIDREVIEGVLPEDEEEEAAAYRLGERKARSLRGLDWREFRQRIGEHLVRRGFSYDTADSTARRLWRVMSDE